MPLGRPKEIKKNGTLQLLTYADDVNLLVKKHKHGTIKNNRNTLLIVSNEDGIEVNAETTKYVFMSRHQDPGQI